MDPASSANDNESEIVRRLQAIVDHASGGGSIDSAANGFAECAEALRHAWSQSAANAPAESLPGSNGEGGVDSGIEPSSLPRCLGRFEIRRMLGHGGFGVVLLAYDGTLAREVALKIPRPELLMVGQMRERFLREAQAVAMLDHPGIVPVFDAGEMGMVWYIAVGYVKGPSLAAWLRQRAAPVPPRVSADIVAALADAVGHAHSRGILHRDLKPSNVLLEPSDPSESRVFPFVAKLTDFGLCKRMETAEDQTLSGRLIGTPRYMAPEQAAGKYREIGVTTDVYGLGAILHELLTGEPPFVGESNSEVMLRIQSEELSPARLRGRGVPKDLETICLKCLDQEQSRRYQTARELADDLRRFITGEPVSARPIGTAARLGRWCRRRPVLAGLSLALTLVTLFGVAGIAWQWRRAEEHLAVSQRETQRAEKNLVQVEQTMIDLAWLFEESNLWKSADEDFRYFMREKLGEYASLIAAQHDPLGQDVAPPVRATILSLAGHKAALDGDQDAADKNLQESINIWCALLRDHPNSRQYQRALGVTLFTLAEHLSNTDRVPAAVGGYEQAQELFDRLSLTDADDPQVRRAYARLQTELASGLVRQGKVKSSLRAMRDATDLWHELALRFPDDLEFLHRQAYLWREMGSIARRMRDHEEELADFQQAHELFADLARRQPERREFRVEVAQIIRLEGEAARALDRGDVAERAYRDAAAAYEQLVKEDPTDTPSRLVLGGVLGELGQLYVDSKNVAAAYEFYQRACEIWEPMYRAGELPKRSAGRMAFYYYHLGLAHHVEKRDDEALAAFQRGAELFRASRDAIKDADHAKLTLAACHVYMGDLLRNRGENDKAIESHQAAVMVFEELLRKTPKDLVLNQRLQKSREKIWQMKNASEVPQTIKKAVQVPADVPATSSE